MSGLATIQAELRKDPAIAGQIKIPLLQAATTGAQPVLHFAAIIARTIRECLLGLRGLERTLRNILCSTLIAFAGLACAQEPTRPLSQYSVRNYTTEQGLPQNEVRSIAQTPDGYLWFGTNDGLARFDGVKFTIYRQETTPGIGHNTGPTHINVHSLLYAGSRK
jgi:hypothetical protein